MQTEVYNRGFSYLNDAGTGVTRTKRWLNLAYQELCSRGPWPFLQTTTSGATPLTISDLRSVLYVVDTVNDRTLRFRDIRQIVDDDPDLDDTGAPVCYWIEGTTQVKCWPTTSTTVSVRYVKVPTDMSAGSDEPLVPDRYRYLIVERAVAYAYADDDEQAQGALQVFEQGFQLMAQDLLFTRVQDGTTRVEVTDGYDWGGVV